MVFGKKQLSYLYSNSEAESSMIAHRVSGVVGQLQSYSSFNRKACPK